MITDNTYMRTFFKFLIYAMILNCTWAKGLGFVERNGVRYIVKDFIVGPGMMANSLQIYLYFKKIPVEQRFRAIISPRGFRFDKELLSDKKSGIKYTPSAYLTINVEDDFKSVKSINIGTNHFLKLNENFSRNGKKLASGTVIKDLYLKHGGVITFSSKGDSRKSMDKKNYIKWNLNIDGTIEAAK